MGEDVMFETDPDPDGFSWRVRQVTPGNAVVEIRDDSKYNWELETSPEICTQILMEAMFKFYRSCATS